MSEKGEDSVVYWRKLIDESETADETGLVSTDCLREACDEIERLKAVVLAFDGLPCNHPGCMAHMSHTCENCGRIGGQFNDQYEDPVGKPATMTIEECRRVHAPAIVHPGVRTMGVPEEPEHDPNL